MKKLYVSSEFINVEKDNNFDIPDSKIIKHRKK